MTAPMEFEIEAEPIDASHLVYVRCSECGAPKVPCAPDQMRVALCGVCRTQVAASAATILRLPAVPPPAMVWSGSEDPGWENRSERAEVVPPELVCPPWCECEKPGPVLDLYIDAKAAGWEALIYHSRARNMQADGKQGAKVQDFWSVRFRRGAWAGYAVRRGKAWDSVCVTGAALPPFLALGVTELRAWLAGPEQPESWYLEILKRKGDQDLASKIVKCPGPGECTWLAAHAGQDHTHRANGDIKIKMSRAERKHGQ